jgi:hypothetical protein
MAQVITFERVTPIARYDDTPWISACVEESATSSVDSAYTLIDTITLDPVDADPSDPVARNLTTELASDTADLWYRIYFVDATDDVSAPTPPIQNVALDGDTYATVNELARILKIRAPSGEQSDAMQRVLLTAAGEINSEIDRSEDDDALAGWQLALCAEVNLERAVEHWQQMESPFGIIGLGAEFGATHTARDSWQRHAMKLAPLKTQWGLA